MIKFLKDAVKGVLLLCLGGFLLLLGVNVHQRWTSWSSEVAWHSTLPSELAVSERIARGSSVDHGRICGAYIYRLTRQLADSLLLSGIDVLPSGLRKGDSPAYGTWRTTPLPPAVFAKYIFDPTRRVGLSCMGGSWAKDWRDAAREPGSYYAENGRGLVLIKRSLPFGGDKNSIKKAHFFAGHFYNDWREKY